MCLEITAAGDLHFQKLSSAILSGSPPPMTPTLVRSVVSLLVDGTEAMSWVSRSVTKTAPTRERDLGNQL